MVDIIDRYIHGWAGYERNILFASDTRSADIKRKDVVVRTTYILWILFGSKAVFERDTIAIWYKVEFQHTCIMDHFNGFILKIGFPGEHIIVSLSLFNVRTGCIPDMAGSKHNSFRKSRKRSLRYERSNRQRSARILHVHNCRA